MTGIASQYKPETDIEMADIILVNNLEVCDTWLPSVSKVRGEQRLLHKTVMIGMTLGLRFAVKDFLIDSTEQQ